jgi:hypothetical protein
MKNAMLALVLIAGSAASVQARPHGFTFRGGPEGHTTINMQSTEGNESYQVTVEDGKVSAKHNDKPIPSDRVKQVGEGDAQKIQILDADGKVVKEFDLHTTRAGAESTRTRIATGWAPAAAPRPKTTRGFVTTPGSAIATTDENPPPVMVGVTMSEAEDGVLNFLGLEKAVVFDRVIDGLPAAKAGIKAGDILVSVKGEKNVDPEHFREILRTMKAGDVLDLKIARTGGELHDLKITLAAFDSQALHVEPEAAAEGGGMIAPEMFDALGSSDARKGWEEARVALDEAMKKLHDKGLDSDQLRKSLDESLAKAKDALKEARDSLREVKIFGNGANPWGGNNGQLHMKLLRPQNGGGIVITPPSAPNAPGASAGEDEDQDERMEKLEKKVQSLDEKLDQVLKLLKDRK